MTPRILALRLEAASKCLEGTGAQIVVLVDDPDLVEAVAIAAPNLSPGVGVSVMRRPPAAPVVAQEDVVTLPHRMGHA